MTTGGAEPGSRWCRHRLAARQEEEEAVEEEEEEEEEAYGCSRQVAFI
jgi:hypothetical protein